ncbi:hypothetical protein B194_3610 [Serratia plymuthica A30]|uniref:hypothetical protein n=1 Tax=Serratia plymuthica TaxID=82996 RepID=UPI0002A2368E|nr:hypothetical protein [Serratia plymuthica]EKF63544.1 hypothetical protein B194_3610 [Serratia plymuthica A30]
MTKTLTPEKLQEIYEAAVHEEATGGDQDAGFELLCKLEDIGGIGATIRKLIDMVRAAIREAQPVAWRHDDGPITQYKSVADKWMSNGWAVTPLYTTPPAPAVPEGYCIMPLTLTAANGAKGALSGEFKVSRTVTCNECGGDGCNDCGDAGEFEEEITVPWDTIKEIYRAAVGVCAQPNAAPEGGN